jgi:hypothetical protein
MGINMKKTEMLIGFQMLAPTPQSSQMIVHYINVIQVPQEADAPPGSFVIFLNVLIHIPSFM